MPIYAYRCDDCGHAFDTLRKISDPVLTQCPACGAEALKKQLTAPGFRLKGGGWYETDFKNGNKKNLHQGSEQPKSASDAPDKKDSKSDASGPAKPTPAKTSSDIPAARAA